MLPKAPLGSTDISTLWAPHSGVGASAYAVHREAPQAVHSIGNWMARGHTTRNDGIIPVTRQEQSFPSEFGECLVERVSEWWVVQVNFFVSACSVFTIQKSVSNSDGRLKTIPAQACSTWEIAFSFLTLSRNVSNLKISSVCGSFNWRISFLHWTRHNCVSTHQTTAGLWCMVYWNTRSSCPSNTAQKFCWQPQIPFFLAATLCGQ